MATKKKTAEKKEEPKIFPRVFMHNTERIGTAVYPSGGYYRPSTQKEYDALLGLGGEEEGAMQTRLDAENHALAVRDEDLKQKAAKQAELLAEDPDKNKHERRAVRHEKRRLAEEKKAADLASDKYNRRAGRRERNNA